MDNLLPGTPVTIGRQRYLIPPLSFKLLRQYAPQLEALSKKTAAQFSADDVTIIIQMVYEAVKRNYPDIPMSEIEDNLDMGNFQLITRAIMLTSGLRQSLDEGEVVGEQQA